MPARRWSARALVDAAGADLDAGRAAAADAKLDEALAIVNARVRALSQTEVRGAHERRMYQHRHGAVTTFLAAYERVAASGTSRAAADQARAIRAHLDRAEARAATGDHAGATEILDRAYALARGDIREMREGRTLTRSLDFATAAEAYDYELGRNASYVELLRFAIAEKAPAGSMLRGIEKNRAEAERLRAEAERAAARGAHGEAIDRLNAATALLQRSIRMAGMFIPG